MKFSTRKTAAVLKNIISVTLSAVISLNVLPVFSAWDGYVESEESSIYSLLDFDNIIKVLATGATASKDNTKNGNMYSMGWKDMNSVTALYLKEVPRDWSEYETLDFWIYSEEATGDQFTVLVETDYGDDGSWNYYWTTTTIDWQGWKKISYPLTNLTVTRTPDYKKVVQVRLASSGWNMKPNSGRSKLYIGDAYIRKSTGISLNVLYEAETIDKAAAALSGGAAVYADSPNVLVKDGEVKALSGGEKNVYTYQIAGTVMVPLCFFENYMSAEVSESETAYSVKLGDNEITGNADDTLYKHNGNEKEFSVSPRILDGMMYIPAAEAAKALGWYTVSDRGLVAVSENEDVLMLNRPYGVNELTEIISYMSGHITVDTKKLTSEDCKAVKDKWRYEVVGSEADNDMTDENIAAKINSIGATGKKQWDKMIKSDNQTELFTDDNTVATANMTSSYNKLYQMALAWGTYGSALYYNEDLKTDIMYGVDWLYNNRYGINELNGEGWRSTNDYNWWDWQIGTPRSLIPVLLILEEEYTKEELQKYLCLFDSVVPTLRGDGSNALNTAKLAIGSALLQEDYNKVLRIQSAIENSYIYVDNGRNDYQGFHTDGSYVFHEKHPMNGTYGLEQLQLIGPFLNMFADTAFEVTTPQAENVSEWIFNAFDPLVYQGAMFRMVKGRYPAGMHTTGLNMLGAILDSLDCLTPEDQIKAKEIIKAQVRDDSTVNFFTSLSLAQVLRLTKVLNDETVEAREAQITNHVYYNEDKVVHQRGDFALGLSMSSSRIFNYESINSCNLTGWYISDGMTEYYVKGDTRQSADAYWSYINPYRIPGTTVDTQERKAVSIRANMNQEYLSSKDFVGAVNLEDTYGTAAMWLESYHRETLDDIPDIGYGGAAPLHESNLEAKKAYFMFDDEVVCLGSDINASNGFEVLTVVDNKLSTKTQMLSSQQETQSYDIAGVEASDTPEPENVADNTTDGEYSTKWAAKTDAAITWDLGTEKTLGFIALAFQNGSKRTQKFKLEISSDGKSWTETFNGSSSGTTEYDEAFSLEGLNGRYVRFTNYGSSTGEWVSITEAKIYEPNADGTMTVAKADVIGADAFMADGEIKALTAEDMDISNSKWAHFENVGGYYFPQSCNLFARYTNQANSFMELWISHGINPTEGTYAYTLLPGKTADQTKAYSENPDIEILVNTENLQVIREKELNITGMVFWKAGSYGDISVSQPMIVMVKENGGEYTVSACDPTQKLESAVITVNKALKLKNCDSTMSVTEGDNTKIELSLSGVRGRTAEAKFIVAEGT